MKYVLVIIFAIAVGFISWPYVLKKLNTPATTSTVTTTPQAGATTVTPPSDPVKPNATTGPVQDPK